MMKPQLVRESSIVGQTVEQLHEEGLDSELASYWFAKIAEAKFDVLKVSHTFAQRQPRALRIHISPSTHNAKLIVSHLDKNRQEVIPLECICKVAVPAQDPRAIVLEHSGSQSAHVSQTIIFRSRAEVSTDTSTRPSYFAIRIFGRLTHFVPSLSLSLEHYS